MELNSNTITKHEFIRNYFDHWEDQDTYFVSTYWLVGSFCERVFSGESLEAVIQQVVKYLNVESKIEGTLVAMVLQRIPWPQDGDTIDTTLVEKILRNKELGEQ